MKKQNKLCETADLTTQKVEFLSSPEAYDYATTVDVCETHLSWVFLTSKYVFKFKKPVAGPLADLTILANRKKFALEEITINKVFAPLVYLSVEPLTCQGGKWEINGHGAALEWLVKMRRLPEKRFLAAAIQANDVPSTILQNFALMLVRYYQRQQPTERASEKFINQLISDICHDCGELIRFGVDCARIIPVSIVLPEFVRYCKDGFERRIEDGRIIECHGDLRPEHVCLTDPPCAIDRLELSPERRNMDPVEELSFLALECEMMQSPVDRVFFDVYTRMTNDVFPPELIHFYKARRAILRAQLSIAHLQDKRYEGDEAKWRNRCEAYMEKAEMYCELVKGWNVMNVKHAGILP